MTDCEIAAVIIGFSGAVISSLASFLVSRVGTGLSGWYGWVIGYILRLFFFLAGGIMVTSLFPVDVSKAESCVLTIAGFILVGVIFDSVFSVFRLKKR